nr:hypothetical protein [uncultured Desulfuromonas sp.]
MADKKMEKIEEGLRKAYLESASPVQPGEEWRQQVMEQITAETIDMPQPFSLPALFSGAGRLFDVSPQQVWGGAGACTLCAVVVGAVAFYASTGMDVDMFAMIVDDPVFETLALLTL